MARDRSIVYKSIVSSFQYYSSAIGIVSNPSIWSVDDKKKLILDAVTDASVILEKNFDNHVSEIEDILYRAAPETKQWLRYQLLNIFQYSETDPQILKIEYPDFSPKFNSVNDDYKIIKYCSIPQGFYGTTRIKLATEVGGNPSSIQSVYGEDAMDAIKAFINEITNPGLNKLISSDEADKCFIQADVFYNSAYSSSIYNNFINSVKSFFKNIPFDGKFLFSDLLVNVKNVEGVIDVVFKNINNRKDTDSVLLGTNMISNYEIINREYDTYSGYIIMENDTDYLPNSPRIDDPSINNINFIPQ